jgi:threonine aldolase
VWTGAGQDECVVRWMTAFDTTPADVDAFTAAIREAAPLARQPAT